MNDPVKFEQTMKKVMEDPEVIKMKEDPALAAIFDKLQQGDSSAFVEYVFCGVY